LLINRHSSVVKTVVFVLDCEVNDFSVETSTSSKSLFEFTDTVHASHFSRRLSCLRRVVRLISWVIIDIVSRSNRQFIRAMNFIASFISIIRLISRRVNNSGIIIRVEVLRFPVSAYKSTSLSEIGSKVNVLLAALNFSFEATAGLTPLLKELLSFFVSTLVS